MTQEELFSKIKLKEEIWKPVKGFEDSYEISHTGRVYSINNKRILEPFINLPSIKCRLKHGGNHKPYFKVKLISKTQKKNYLIHRLVADNFLENPENKPIVHHRNEITTDNRIQNLEWCTGSENAIYSVNKKKEKKLKEEKVLKESDGQLLMDLDC